MRVANLFRVQQKHLFLIVFVLSLLLSPLFPVAASESRLPKIRVAPDVRGFRAEDGRPFAPMGLTYFRPGTGWAPQLWKQFDPDATRADFARMKELGVNCVRVFLSYGSFQMETNRLSEAGLAKLDQFLDMAEAAGIYVHPTGPDHWEGTPDWVMSDRMADETVLQSLETFWQSLAARYRARPVIFAYDLRNEPEVGWDTPELRQKWNRWLKDKYGSARDLARAWGTQDPQASWREWPIPEAKDKPRDPQLLDYQRFRESVADEWTSRQVAAIKSVDPDALVTVGLIQWSVPTLLPRVSHYAAFRPQRQAAFLDFLEIHFYPLNDGFYEYRGVADETGNLAYLESVVGAVAAIGKPVVVAEFGWYGGGRLTIDQGKHAPASEAQQARWCRRVIESTAGLAVGYLNWGFYDHPQARDVTQLTGLLTADGRLKEWGVEFAKLARANLALPAPSRSPRPEFDWDLCVTSTAAGTAYRQALTRAFAEDAQAPSP